MEKAHLCWLLNGCVAIDLNFRRKITLASHPISVGSQEAYKLIEWDRILVHRKGWYHWNAK